MGQNLAKKSQEENQQTDDSQNQENKPGRLLEIIEPKQNFSEKIKYIELKKGAIHPIEKAEQQVEYLSVDFEEWLDEDIKNLMTAWQEYKSHKNDPNTFSNFNKAVHQIKGNAQMLNNEYAGQLAATLSRLIERTCNLDEHIDAVELMVQAIRLCVANKKKNCKNFDEVKQGFDVIIDSRIAQI